MFLAELMGFSDYIPPFAGASPQQAHTGINYASGAAGILEETSYHLVRTYLKAREINLNLFSCFFLKCFIFINTTTYWPNVTQARVIK